MWNVTEREKESIRNVTILKSLCEKYWFIKQTELLLCCVVVILGIATIVFVLYGKCSTVAHLNIEEKKAGVAGRQRQL